MDSEKVIEQMEWLELTEAAREISVNTGKKINEAGVLRLALNGHLKLSVILRSFARPCTLSSELYLIPTGNDPAAWEAYDACKNAIVKSACCMWQGKRLVPEGLTYLDGIYDLLVIAGIKNQLYKKVYELINKQECPQLAGNAVFVENENGKIFQIQYFSILNVEFVNGIFIYTSKLSPFYDNYYPAWELPKDSMLVVTPKALQNFLECLHMEDDKENSQSIKNTKSLIPAKDRYKNIFKELKGQVKRRENTNLRIISALFQILIGKIEKSTLPYESNKSLIIDITYNLIKNNNGTIAKIGGLNETILGGRFSDVNKINITSPIVNLTDMCIMKALFELLKGRYPEYDLPFLNDNALIAAIANILKNLENVDEEILKIRIERANRQLFAEKK